MTYEIYKIYEGDTCSSGVFMVCFESSIIYLVKKILRRKGGTWLIKIVQNGKERIVTANQFFVDLIFLTCMLLRISWMLTSKPFMAK